MGYAALKTGAVAPATRETLVDVPIRLSHEFRGRCRPPRSSDRGIGTPQVVQKFRHRLAQFPTRVQYRPRRIEWELDKLDEILL